MDDNMSVNKLLWLGCGDCEGLKFFHSQFDEMLLIDARSLDELSIPEDIEDFYQQLVISSDEKLTTFKETNIPELSSINGDKCFLLDFPGLEVERERETYAKSLVNIVQGFFTDADTKTLILDIPDSQIELVTKLSEQDALSDIDEIIVWNVPQINEEGLSKELVKGYLEDNGFVSFSRGENFSGYDWIHYIPNPLFSDYTLSRKKLKELDDKLKEENKKNKELQEKYELLRKTGIRLESQIELMAKLISFDSE